MSRRQEKLKARAAAVAIGGCTLRRDLLTLGYSLDSDLRGNGHLAVEMFSQAVQQLPRVPAILDPVDRVKPGVPCTDWTSARPPFELQYIETLFEQMRFGCLVGCSDPEPDQPRSVMMIGWSQHNENVDRRPKAVAWVRLELDDAGTAVKVCPARLFQDRAKEGLEAGAEVMFAYAVHHTIQILTANNVGMHQIISPDATNRRMPRYIRDRAAAERYHVLVMKDPRSGRTLYEPRADGQQGVMPLHVARGHWAKYGPEYNAGLLFGKLAGRFWVPETEKGRSSNGIVKKDYAIAAPPAADGELRRAAS